MLRRTVGILAVLSLASAAPLCQTASSSYDYIVVGGGTSGLVVANRLSENPNVSVLVIEAGDSVYNNANVTNVNGYGLAFGTPIDWQYQSTNQTYAGNTRQTLRAGKALGGTSTINGMAYTRAQDVQIDAWAAIGNDGWDWSSLWPYYLKSEAFTAPNQTQRAAGASYNPAYHGVTGPLHVGFIEMQPNNLSSILNQTYQALGVPWTEDVNGGKMRGYNFFPSTVDDAADVREDAARAYYYPFESRPNLRVMLNTLANRIVWKNETSGGNVTADGVEVTPLNGTVCRIQANNEVILSAGSLRSPGILELSGVGNPSILNKYNIPVKVNLPTVGENMQDQMYNDASAEGYSAIAGTKSVAYPSVTDLFGNRTSAVAASVQNQLAQYAEAAANQSQGTMKASDLQRLFQIQYDLIFKQEVPIAEIITYPTGNTLAAGYWGLLPFARGSVHIASADPTVQPVINPNYFMFDWDVQQQIGTAKFIRNLYKTAPLSSLVKNETEPGSAVPEGASDSVWEAWLKETYRSNFHPVGTAAIMPRSIGGVVDERLRVYGTANVRVVDASVLPFQICGHLTSTL
ncbi:Glucose oxidase [Rasamsonia emersonii CBS 393.64]|uniref:glucose oxidase n=2 Tax=Rasamsonia emersonii TaxID=68825 RepID=A0A0F4YPS7_RASE3|nr:Glucose oxidase [Rasamsonia emersonii CBS 393.64]KKA20115.1 Glucose oxidase [Rasamsonia emersonii CBS 393.64]